MADDLNVSEAFAAMFELLRAGNKFADAGTLSAAGAAKILDAFRKFDRIAGCLEPDRVRTVEIPAEVMAMAEARLAAKFNREGAQGEEFCRERPAESRNRRSRLRGRGCSRRSVPREESVNLTEF